MKKNFYCPEPNVTRNVKALILTMQENTNCKLTIFGKTFVSTIIVFALLSLGPSSTFGQNAKRKKFSLDSLTSKNLRFLPVPVVSVSPEGGATFGFFVDYFYNTEGKNSQTTRASNSWIQATYSTKGQFILVGFSSTFTPKEKYFVGFRGGFTSNYERFWGYTKDVALNETFTDITFQRSYANLKLLKNLKRSVFIGPTLYYSSFKKTDTSNSLNSSILEMPIMDSKVAALGLNVSIDKRDNQFSPTAGYYVDLGAQYTANLNETGNNYFSFNSDFRGYYTLNKSEIAQQLFIAAASDDMPDLEKYKIGGGNVLRGMFQGRFRDNAVWYTQSEYRYNINRFFKLAAFAGFGNTAPSFDQMLKQPVQATGGIGGRMLINKTKKVYLRLDVGFAARGFVGYYLRVGDAF